MEKLAKKKAKLKAAEARIRARISVRERKRRTRRLILIGSYMEHVTKTDPDRKARLMKELDGFLERDRDRELFDLLPKEGSHLKPSKIEARMNLEDNERKFYRQMLGWILLIPAVGVSSWLLALYSPAVALTVFVVLPFSGMVLYLVWKGWIEKRAK